MVTTRRSWVWAVAAVVSLGGAAEGCKNREIPEGQCIFNTDCDSPLVCAGRFCRQPCNPDMSNGRDPNRDCPTGWRCLSSGERNQSVCLPPGENGYCVYHSDCREPYVCTRDGRCSAQCVTDRDCINTALDPSARCSMVDGVGVCDFRDAGPRVVTDASSDATSSGRDSDGSTL